MIPFVHSNTLLNPLPLRFESPSTNKVHTLGSSIDIDEDNSTTKFARNCGEVGLLGDIFNGMGNFDYHFVTLEVW